MKEDTINITTVIAEILSKENKNKSLGEVSDELNEYLIEIKEAVESGDITYEFLQKEIANHLDENEKTIPGSLAQLLIGCVSEDGSCPLKNNQVHDIPFVYDNKYNKIFPISKQLTPYNENSYAVLYFTGQPKNLKPETLKYLEENGFNKLKIEYKNIDSSNYKTIYIENLKKYIYAQPEKGDDNLLYLIGILVILLLVYLIIKN